MEINYQPLNKMQWGFPFGSGHDFGSERFTVANRRKTYQKIESFHQWYCLLNPEH